MVARVIVLEETIREKSELGCALTALRADADKLRSMRMEEATVDLRFAIVDQDSESSDPMVLVLKDDLESLPASRLSSMHLKFSGSPLRIEDPKARSEGSGDHS